MFLVSLFVSLTVGLVYGLNEIVQEIYLRYCSWDFIEVASHYHFKVLGLISVLSSGYVTYLSGKVIFKVIL